MARTIEFGDIFGFWTVASNKNYIHKTISQKGVEYSTTQRWCECACGTKKYVNIQGLFKGTSVSCGCKQKKEQYKGKESFSATLYHRIKSAAKARKIEFKVSLEYLWELYLKQDRKCAISGVPIYFWEKKNKNIDGTKDKTASLDRIESSKGYIEGNVQWIHKEINFMKYTLSTKQLIQWCQMIINHQKSPQAEISQ